MLSTSAPVRLKQMSDLIDRLRLLLRKIPVFAWWEDYDGSWMRTLWMDGELMTPTGWKWVGDIPGDIYNYDGRSWQWDSPDGKFHFWPPNKIIDHE